MEKSFLWVLACIQTSSNAFQFTSCHTLIELFEAMYKGDEGIAKYSTIDLKEALHQQEIKHGIDA